MYHSVGDADRGEGLAYVQIRSMGGGVPVPSLLFYSELQTALKNKLLIMKTMPIKNSTRKVDAKHTRMLLKFSCLDLFAFFTSMRKLENQDA